MKHMPQISFGNWLVIASIVVSFITQWVLLGTKVDSLSAEMADVRNDITLLTGSVQALDERLRLVEVRMSVLEYAVLNGGAAK